MNNKRCTFYNHHTVSVSAENMYTICGINTTREQWNSETYSEQSTCDLAPFYSFCFLSFSFVLLFFSSTPRAWLLYHLSELVSVLPHLNIFRIYRVVPFNVDHLRYLCAMTNRKTILEKLRFIFADRYVFRQHFQTVSISWTLQIGLSLLRSYVDP